MNPGLMKTVPLFAPVIQMVQFVLTTSVMNLLSVVLKTASETAIVRMASWATAQCVIEVR